MILITGTTKDVHHCIMLAGECSVYTRKASIMLSTSDMGRILLLSILYKNAMSIPTLETEMVGLHYIGLASMIL